jgi:hypothetical protein
MSKEVNEPAPPAPLPEPEKIVGQNGVPQNASKDARNPDWVARHRLAAAAIPLWSLVVILIGILTILLLKSILFPR